MRKPDRVPAEHVEVRTRGPRNALDGLRNYGALFPSRASADCIDFISSPFLSVGRGHCTISLRTCVEAF